MVIEKNDKNSTNKVMIAIGILIISLIIFVGIFGIIMFTDIIGEQEVVFMSIQSIFGIIPLILIEWLLIKKIAYNSNNTDSVAIISSISISSIVFIGYFIASIYNLFGNYYIELLYKNISIGFIISSIILMDWILIKKLKHFLKLKNGKDLNNKVKITVATILLVVLFPICIPIYTCMSLIILFHWLLIKKLTHDFKIKLSIVLLIIGILMIIGAGFNINTISQKSNSIESELNIPQEANSIKANLNINNDYESDLTLMYLLIGVGGFITLEGFIFLIGSGKKQSVNKEKNEECEPNNERYSVNLNDQNKTNENNIIYDYKEKLWEISKIFNLYKNEIYNEQEYRSKKENWIESLKLLNFHKAETDFLNEMLPHVKDGVLEKSELETIKYIVSGEYEKDKYREAQEQKIKSEEEAQKNIEETINNVKNKTKEMTSSTINKISSIVSNNTNERIHVNEPFVCECGEKLEEGSIFCANCGKEIKLKDKKQNKNKEMLKLEVPIKKSKKYVYFMIILGAFLSLGLLITFLFSAREHVGTIANIDGTETVYVGEIRYGKPNGQGTGTFANGDKYVGEFKSGKANGQGTKTYGNGNKYVGEFKDNEFNGQGAFTYGNGNKDVGEFKYGKLYDGQRTFTDANGNKYVGEFKSYEKNGQGILTYADGDKYVGEFKDGNLNGQGTFAYVSGNKYVGEFKDSKLHGQGTLTFAEGHKYVGEFKDGRFNGQGTKTYASGSKYVGEFKDGKFNGQGTFTGTDGNKYVGEFKDGEFNGQGTFTYADGGKYVGGFKSGLLNGQGTATYANGDKYVGEFLSDDINGQGTYTYANGTIKQGNWTKNRYNGN